MEKKMIPRIFLFSILLAGCSSRPPAVDVTFWSANSEVDGIQRPQEGKVISCQSAQFDNYSCISYDDVAKLFKAFLQCKQWSGPLMTKSELKTAYRKNQPVIDVVSHLSR